MRTYRTYKFGRSGQCTNPEGNRMGIVEAQTREDAVDILLNRQKAKRRSEKQTKKHHDVSIRARQAASARMSAYQLERRNKPKTPHPFHDLTDEEKRLKMRAMFETGLWGLRLYATRKLADKFRVTVGQATLWLEDCEERL